MRVLVTGSAGHLGEALIRTLRRAGSEVIGLDTNASAFTDVQGSITDRPLPICVGQVPAPTHHHRVPIWLTVGHATPRP